MIRLIKSGRESTLIFCEQTFFYSKKVGFKMAKHEVYEQKTEKLLEPILAEHHFELYDVEYVRRQQLVSTGFIDKKVVLL